MQSILTSSFGLNRKLIGLYIAALVLISAFVLFFIMANNTWVVINIPNLPWKPEPSWAAFETRLWGVMLVSFVVGIAVWQAISLLWVNEQQKKAALKNSRIRQLEEELKRVHQLLSEIHEKG